MCKLLVYVKYLGLITFQKALCIQNVIVQQHLQALKSQPINFNVLLLLEHYPVYTIGIRTKDYTELDELKLKNIGADFIKTNRGGLITFHGPGQLVVYPILNLAFFKKSLRWYINQLEQTVIELCSKFHVSATINPYTGVWVGNNKIAAIGVHASRFVTSHGIAINCNIDLTWFDHIIPCGIPDKGVTSLSQETGHTVTVQDVHLPFLEAFQNHFQCRIINDSICL